MRILRILKIGLVAGFSLWALAPSIATRVSALTSLQSTPSQKTSQLVDASQYVGSDSCIECHAAEATHYQLSAHAKTNLTKYSADRRGCEGCHGPAKGHLDFYLAIQKLNEASKETEAGELMNDTAKAAAAKMKSFTEMTSAESSSACLKCHEGSQGQSEERFNFRRSEHHRHGVSCNDCHSSHSPKRTESLLKDSEPNMCYQCHADQKASFMKPFHHKVPEGGMKCSDCHNQHGGFAPKSLRSAITGDIVCIKCHTDKQGPFVYEHAPVKTNGCQTCHTPHGSTNAKLLTRNTIRFLCLECHSNTPGIPDTEAPIGGGVPSFHDLNSVKYQHCTVCHYEIHGSNKDPAFR